MKRTIVMFVISALVVVSLALWVLKGHVAGNTREMIHGRHRAGAGRLRRLPRNIPAPEPPAPASRPKTSYPRRS